MRISKQATEFFNSKGSNAGSVHRVCVYRFGVFPESAALAINTVALNGESGNTAALHQKVFEEAKHIDANKRIYMSHNLTELESRVARLENRGFVKWLESIFQQETPLLW